MIKEPEDEAFDELEKAQQRNALLVDKGCAERGCMGYDSRDGDAPVEMSIHRPWVDLTEERIKEIWLNGKDHGDDWQDVLALARAFETELRSINK